MSAKIIPIGKKKEHVNEVLQLTCSSGSHWFTRTGSLFEILKVDEDGYTVLIIPNGPSGHTSSFKCDIEVINNLKEKGAVFISDILSDKTVPGSPELMMDFRNSIGIPPTVA